MKANKKLNKKVVIVVGIIFLGLLTFIIYQSYALFKTNKKMNFINAKVGEFGPNGDIIVNIYVDNVKQEEFPAKSGYKFDEMICTNSGVAIFDETAWSLKINEISGPTKCDVYFVENIEAPEIFSTSFGGSGEDSFVSITHGTDGGYVVAGTTTTSKDGDYLINHIGILGGGGYNALIVKYDVNDDVVWSHAFGNGENYTAIGSVTTAVDGGYIVVGQKSTRFNDDVYQNLAQITKIGENGYQVWSQTFGSGYNPDYFASVAPTSDGGAIAVGYTLETSRNGSYALTSYKGTLRGQNDGIIVKYDANGNIVWSNSFGSTSIEFFYSVSVTSDGGFIAAGQTSASSKNGDLLFNHKGTLSGNYDGIIVKYDSNGNLVWSNSFGSTASEVFKSVTLTPDAGYIAVGYTNATSANGDLLTNHKGTLRGSGDCLIVKYDSNGNLVWSNSFGSSAFEEFQSVTSTQDGGYIAVGNTGATSANGDFSTNHKGTLRGGQDGLIVKFNANGNLVWSSSFGSTVDDQFYSITSTSDRRYIVAGYTKTTSKNGDFLFNYKGTLRGSTDGIIVKFDS